jgi:hypothetical protein
MKVRKLTIEQKDLLIGKVWGYENQIFNPVLDANGNWFISNEEVNGCDKPEFQWLKSCELIEHNPVVPNVER